MTKPKKETPSKTREIKVKKPRFGLKVHAIPLPHDFLIKPEVVDGNEIQTSGRPSLNVDGKPSTFQPKVDGKPSTPQTSGRPEAQTSGRPRPSTQERHKYPKETIRLKPDIFKRINYFCIEKAITKQEFWEMLAVHFFNLVDGLPSTWLNQFVDGLPSHDDKMIYTTHDDIIMRYETYTGQTWNRRDDREGQRYNDTDIRIIEIAFITTIEKKLRGNTSKQPIKSFNYFIQEIDLLLEQKRNQELPSTFDDYFRYVLNTWEKRIKPLRDEKWNRKSEKQTKS